MFNILRLCLSYPICLNYKLKALTYFVGVTLSTDFGGLFSSWYWSILMAFLWGTGYRSEARFFVDRSKFSPFFGVWSFPIGGGDPILSKSMSSSPPSSELWRPRGESRSGVPTLLLFTEPSLPRFMSVTRFRFGAGVLKNKFTEYVKWTFHYQSIMNCTSFNIEEILLKLNSALREQ